MWGWRYRESNIELQSLVAILNKKITKQLKRKYTHGYNWLCTVQMCDIAKNNLNGETLCSKEDVVNNSELIGKLEL